MKFKTILSSLLAPGLCMAWLALADWIFWRLTRRLDISTFPGRSGLHRRHGQELIYTAFTVQKIYDALFSGAVEIDRHPLFPAAFLQISTLFAAVGFVMKGSLYYRRLAIGYIIALIFLSFAGFCTLHWCLRPAFDKCRTLNAREKQPLWGAEQKDRTPIRISY